MSSGIFNNGGMTTDFSEPSVYMLLEQNPIIAADLMGTLKTVGAAEVIHLTAPEALLEALSNLPRLAFAFLEMSPLDFLGSDIEAALKDLGAQIVLTKGDAPIPEGIARGWKMLIRPFTDQMVMDVLTTANQR